MTRYGPWKLTPAQALALDAVYEHGRNAAAAASLGIKLRTLETQIERARARMGHTAENRLTRFTLLRMWAEYRERV